MTTALLPTFLIVHNLLHLPIWLPRPDPHKSVPFTPQASGVLSAAHADEAQTAQKGARDEGIGGL